jgi:hypothetical protein
MKLISSDVLHMIISYLNPLYLTDFFEAFCIPYNFKFKYDMSNICIYVCNNYKHVKWSLFGEANYINYYEYKNISKKLKNMTIYGIKLKFDINKVVNLKLLNNIGFTNLNNIKCIKLSGLPKYDMSTMDVSCIENLNNLEILSIKYFYLESESDVCKINCSHMHSFTILHCKKTTPFKFALIGNLTKLKTIKCDDFIFSCEKCTNLTNIHYYGNTFDLTNNLFKLECLVLNGVDKIDLLDIYKIGSIKSLTLNKCTSILNTSYLKQICLNLKEISITNNSIDLNFLKNYNNLESIHLAENDRLLDIDFLENMSNLKKLKICGCFNLENIDMLNNFYDLEELSIVYCSDLSEIDLVNNGKLKYIEFKFFGNTKVYNFENCKNLIIFDIYHYDIINIDFLQFSKIKILKMDYCNGIKHLDTTSLTECTKFIISNCNNLESIHGKTNLSNLETFVVYNCYKLEKINILHNCINLHKLSLQYNYRLTDVDDLINCKKLNYVCVYGPYIKNIENLKSNKNIIMDIYELYHHQFSKNFYYNMILYNSKSNLIKYKGIMHHGFLKKFLLDLYTDVTSLINS